MPSNPNPTVTFSYAVNGTQLFTTGVVASGTVQTAVGAQLQSGWTTLPTQVNSGRLISLAVYCDQPVRYFTNSSGGGEVFNLPAGIPQWFVSGGCSGGPGGGVGSYPYSGTVTQTIWLFSGGLASSSGQPANLTYQAVQI